MFNNAVAAVRILYPNNTDSHILRRCIIIDWPMEEEVDAYALAHNLTLHDASAEIIAQINDARETGWMAKLVEGFREWEAEQFRR